MNLNIRAKQTGHLRRHRRGFRHQRWLGGRERTDREGPESTHAGKGPRREAHHRLPSPCKPRPGNWNTGVGPPSWPGRSTGRASARATPSTRNHRHFFENDKEKPLQGNPPLRLDTGLPRGRPARCCGAAKATAGTRKTSKPTPRKAWAPTGPSATRTWPPGTTTWRNLRALAARARGWTCCPTASSCPPCR